MSHVVQSAALGLRPWGSMLMALAVLLPASSAWSQQARPAARPQQPAAKTVDPKAAAANQVTEVKREHTKLRIPVTGVRSTGTITPAVEATVKQYYEMYGQLITLSGLVAELPAMRQEIKRETVAWGAAADKKGLATVNQILLAKMQEVALDTKQPVVGRINAILVIGDLNDVETDRVGRGEPKAMAAAAPVLLAIFSDDKMGDAVKVAALVGLLRHAQIGIEDKQLEKQIVAELEKVVAQEEVPETSSIDGHQWIRRRAIEIVTTIYARQGTAPSKEYSAALESIVANQDYPLMFRAEAAEALGRVGGAEGKIVDALGETALEISKMQLPPRAYRLYFRSLQRCLTGPDAKSGVLPKLPLTEKKLGEELSELLKGIEVRMDRIGSNATMMRDQMVLETQRIEEWMATYKTPEEETTDPAAPANPAPAEGAPAAPAAGEPAKVEAKADAAAPAAAPPAQPAQPGSSGN